MGGKLPRGGIALNLDSYPSTARIHWAFPSCRRRGAWVSRSQSTVCELLGSRLPCTVGQVVHCTLTSWRIALNRSRSRVSLRLTQWRFLKYLASTPLGLLRIPLGEQKRLEGRGFLMGWKAMVGGTFPWALWLKPPQRSGHIAPGSSLYPTPLPAPAAGLGSHREG